MSANPRVVLSSMYLIWDVQGAVLPLFVRAGTVVDVVPGSKLEAAYGAANLSGIVPVAQRGDGTCWSKAALSN